MDLKLWQRQFFFYAFANILIVLQEVQAKNSIAISNLLNSEAAKVFVRFCLQIAKAKMEVPLHLYDNVHNIFMF